MSSLLTAVPSVGAPKGRLFSYEEGVAPAISRGYDVNFRPNQDYLDSMPDMGLTVGAIEGADVEIQQVGVSGFRLPLRVQTSGGQRELEAKISGSVCLGAGKKGINMSRILRTFYAHLDEPFGLQAAVNIAEAYLTSLEAPSARLKVKLSYPMLLTSLRSGLEGWQYYPVTFIVDASRHRLARCFLELEFTYSSACPCSAELVEQAREVRGVYGVPHSQRSKAMIRVELRPGAELSVEELIEAARRALHTETQVLVKREDEQAFAELNGAYLKFVEDAARLLFKELMLDERIEDFQVACAHFESLHSHDAVSVICKGVKGGYPPYSEDWF